MYNLDIIEDKILELLQPIKGDGQVFNEIKNNFELNTTFPYCGFELVDSNITKIDTCNNSVEGIFEIYSFMEINDEDGIDRASARDIIKKGTKEITEILQKNETLDGNVINSDIESISFNTIDEKNGIMYYSKITYRVELYYNINIL